MDTLTHALSGALLARATAPEAPSQDDLPVARRVTVGFLAAAFPDLDFVSRYFSPLGYLYGHRGITHSVLMLPLWAIALGWLCAWACRDRGRWRTYAKVAAAGIAIHILGDLITSYGTMIFAPLSDARFAWSTTFVIDLWFTGIILLGLAGAAVWRRSKLPAVIALSVLAGYVGFQYLLQQRAVRFGVEFAATRGFRDATVSAMPRPASPFNWMVVVARPDQYDYTLVNLVRNKASADGASSGFFAAFNAPYRPMERPLWVRAERFGETPDEVALAQQAYGQPAFGFFRWFAAYPALMRIDRANPETCVWFHDLRFFTPGRGVWPFRYGMCREGSGPWAPYRLLDDDRRVPVS